MLSDLDLNLLRVLDVLLEERNTTRTARRLGRSQPAISHALGRLRETLGDALLVREGRALVLTPRAEAMRDPLRHALRTLSEAVREGSGFDPSTAHRTFVLASPALLAPLVPSILAELTGAPHVSVELLSRRGTDALGLADVVVDVLPEDASGVVARGIGRVHQGVLVRRAHPFLEAPTLEAFVRYPHVLVRTDDGRSSVVERSLLEAGMQRRVGLAVDSMLLVPHVVAQTDLMFTGPREVLEVLTEPLGLALAPLPLALPPVPVAVMWRSRDAGEAGHRWFREGVVRALEGVLS